MFAKIICHENTKMQYKLIRQEIGMREFAYHGQNANINRSKNKQVYHIFMQEFNITGY